MVGSDFGCRFLGRRCFAIGSEIVLPKSITARYSFNPMSASNVRPIGVRRSFFCDFNGYACERRRRMPSPAIATKPKIAAEGSGIAVMETRNSGEADALAKSMVVPSAVPVPSK